MSVEAAAADAMASMKSLRERVVAVNICVTPVRGRLGRFCVQRSIACSGGRGRVFASVLFRTFAEARIFRGSGRAWSRLCL